MAQQTINVGASPNDGTGTPLRTAFQYTNSNFSELYTATGPSGNNIVVPGSATISGDLTVDTSTLKVDSTNNRVGILTATPRVSLDVASGNGYVSGQFDFGGTGPGANAQGFLSYSGGNAIVGSYGNTSLLFYTNGAEQMRLNANGLGVGGSPTAKISCAGYSSANQLPDISIVRSSSGTAIQTGPNIVFTDGTSNNSVTIQNSQGRFGIWNYGAGAWNERLSVDSSGNVGIGVTPSAGKGCLQLSSGINFPATQVLSSDANTLDDYEEGTFTPTIIGTSTAGTGTYSAQYGTYTKVGRLVSCQIFLNWTAHTGTGDMRISGLPFQVSGASNYFAAAAIGYLSNVSLSAGNIATGYAINATSVITLGQYPTGGGAGAGIAMDTSGEIIISVTYIV